MKNGSSLIETMVYVAVLAMVFGVFTSLVLAVNRSYAQIAIIRNLDIAGITVMERITREIRDSSSIDTPNSTFGSTPGILSLKQTDQNGIVSNIIFKVTGQNIQIKVDGVDQGTLLPSGVTVPSLIFRSIDSGKSKAVKIEIQLVAQAGNITRTQNYYATIILRGSYK